MTMRRAIAAICACLVLAIAAGCSSPAATTLPPTTRGNPAPVVGIVTHVDTSGLDQVRGFTLRDGAGNSLEFVIGALDDPTAFPPGHLGEHVATAEPVRVFFRWSGTQRLVYRLEDAAASASPSA